MAELSITFIEAGWGDSIFLHVEENGNHQFALIDSNDTTGWPSSQVFLKRYMERHHGAGRAAFPHPLFDFVLATHSHADHVSGLRALLRRYGARQLYTPRFDPLGSAAAANLLRWGSRYPRFVGSHEYLHRRSTFTFGPVVVSVLWPPPPATLPSDAPYDPHDENHNSLVLDLRLGSVHMVLTGDCTASNWTRPSPGAPWGIALPASGLKLVQVPHHGAENGIFDGGSTPMLDQIADLAVANPSVEPLLAVSCHPVPHHHPHPRVASLLDTLPLPGSSAFGTSVPGTHWLRTDRSLHSTVWTDGTRVELRARPPA